VHGELTGTLLVICGLAFAWGVRHGLDADHLATIDGLARRAAGNRPGLASFAGTLFSFGHGLVVLAVAVGASFAASRWHTPGWLELSGTVVSVVFLLGLAFLNLHAVWTTPHHHVVVPTGLKSRLFNRLVSVEHPLVIMGVGMLFALSFDTISQAALFAAAAAQFGSVGHTLLVAGAFVAGMMLADGLNGFWIARLIRRADRRAALASRIMATSVGLVSLAVGAFIVIKLASPVAEAWAENAGLWMGVGVIGVVAVAFGGAMLFAGKGASHDHAPAE